MSSCDAQRVSASRIGPRVRAAVGVALLAATGISLSGCGDGGFRPMYAASPSGVRTDEKLAAIEISPIGGKVGQRLRNELIFHTTGGGNAATPEYRLEITLVEATAPTLVKSTGEATAGIYTLDAKFRLVDLKSKKVILEGASFGRALFERYQSIYSNVRAADDAQNRAARTIADDLKVRLAAFLSGKNS